MKYNFEWELSKAETNLKKHKVRFERATEIFLDPFMLSIYDEVHSKSEDRWITIGKDNNNVCIVVVHSFREVDPENNVIRIISARHATSAEEKQYNTR